MEGGYIPLTLDKMNTVEGVNLINRMFDQLFKLVAGDGQTVRIYAGYGSPESAVVAGIGSLYLRYDGGAGTSLYVKQSGTGATGWVGK